MWNDISEWELRLADEAIKALQNVSWAAPLLAQLAQTKGTREQERSLLFEIRFAYALHQAGHSAEYECPGIDTSTIDFRVKTLNFDWRIELVSLFESDAVREATTHRGQMHKLILTDLPGRDNIASEAGEMIKAGEKIGEKVFSKGKPTKFPLPSDNTIHVIVTDMRGYLGVAEQVMDNNDCLHIARGPAGLPDHHVRYWRNAPVKGVFQQDNPTQAAKYARERIHILAFVCEKEYTATEICSRIFCVPNLSLFRSKEEARTVLRECPIRVGTLVKQ